MHAALLRMIIDFPCLVLSPGSLPKLSNLNEFQWKKIIRNNSFIAHGEKSLAHHRPEKTQRHAELTHHNHRINHRENSAIITCKSWMKKNYYTLEKKTFSNHEEFQNFRRCHHRAALRWKFDARASWNFSIALRVIWLRSYEKKGSTAVWRTQKKATTDSKTNSKIIREPTKIKTSIMTFSLMKEKWMKEKREEDFFVGWMKHLRVGSIQLYRLVSILQASKSINYLARD